MKISCFLLCAAIISGCAAPQNKYIDSGRIYADQNKILAENGSIKWSEYYTGLYSRQTEAGAPATELQRINELIRYAQQYEGNTITKDQFEYHRRAANIASNADQLAAEDRNRSRRAAAAAAIIAGIPKYDPIPYQIVPSGNLPVIGVPSFAPSQQQAGVTAHFTGRQERVQTVTYKSGWKCEYRYLGRTFTKIFTGSCPSSVQVE